MHTTSPQPQNSKALHRIAPLSTLPVFFTLAGKKVLMAGGSDAAVWKAELLAASGANVHVLATHADISEEMQRLATYGASAGSILLTGTRWQDSDFSGAALAVGDIEEPEVDGFIARARAASVPVNVIDKPAFCDFQFGTIVNRSPVVIGISTTGAAPILGQAVRRRIEAVLPPALVQWAGMARDLRDAVMTRFARGSERRTFWEALSRCAFAPMPERLKIADVHARIDMLATPARQAGRVTTIQVNSPDADLLTLRAVRQLQGADMIVADASVSTGILEMGRREARRIRVPEGASETKALLQKLTEDGCAVVHVTTKSLAAQNTPHSTLPILHRKVREMTLSAH